MGKESIFGGEDYDAGSVESCWSLAFEHGEIVCVL